MQKPPQFPLPGLPLGSLAWAALALAIAAAPGQAQEPAAAATPAQESAQPGEEAAPLAPPGACAEPRGLGLGSAPSSFDIAGPPASRLSPSQVAAQLGPVAPPAPVPSVPAPPSPSLCDDPGACSSGGPAFIEPEPVPGLPPGVGGP